MTRLQAEARSLEAAIDPVTALVTQTGQADSDPAGRSSSDAASIGGQRPGLDPDRHVGTPVRESDGTRPRV